MKTQIISLKLVFPNKQAIEYTLEQKNNKNINIKISKNGGLRVSAPRHVPLAYINSLLIERKDWILKSIVQQRSKRSIPTGESKSQALEIFEKSLDRIMLMLYANDFVRPSIRVRRMKSLWGSCIPSKQVITLNTALIHLDTKLIDYVVLHEVVHLKYSGHDKAYWNCVKLFMPEYNIFRQELKKYNL